MNYLNNKTMKKLDLRVLSTIVWWIDNGIRVIILVILAIALYFLLKDGQSDSAFLIRHW